MGLWDDPDRWVDSDMVRNATLRWFAVRTTVAVIAVVLLNVII